MARAKTAPPSHEEFVFEVRAPSWSYSFRLQHEKHHDDPYAERQALEFVALCLYPDRFKGREVEVRLYGERSLIEVDRKWRRDEAPKGVGTLVATKTKFELWGALPSDACWQIGAGMAAGAVRYLLVNAPVFAPKHSFINSMSFEGPGFDAHSYVG